MASCLGTSTSQASHAQLPGDYRPLAMMLPQLREELGQPTMIQMALKGPQPQQALLLSVLPEEGTLLRVPLLVVNLAEGL
eukprot:5602135-Amphidinium_carterae.1